MIKDYRFHADEVKGKTPGRLFTSVKYSLLVLVFGVVVYTALAYWRPEISAQTQVQTAGSLTRERIALALPSLDRADINPEKTDEPLTTESVNTPETSTTSQPSQSTEVTQTELSSEKSYSQQLLEEITEKAVPAGHQSDTELNPVTENAVRSLEESVKKGDSISRIFSRIDLSAKLLQRILNSGDEAKQLAHIRPGETLKVKVDEQGKFLGLILERSAIKSLHIQAMGDEFETRTVERGVEKRTTNASGTITDSLYQSAQRAGLSDQLIMQLADIFGWDIDFALEIRSGDQFSLVFEEEYLDGEFYGSGPILAAEFVNRGKIFRAIRYQDQMGNINYFSPDGRSMRKAFLRAPVDFRRISSRFTKARWHPVLGKKRPHKGVDYAAATGTPIKASGDGRVIFRGRKGGYGNSVIIKHGRQYTTLYGHMSRYKRSVKKGTRVSQGQVIGYVGKTGLATGPHLHYEFRVNGVHRNPLTVKIPAASPINKEYKKDFEEKSRPLLTQLDVISRTQVATAE